MANLLLRIWRTGLVLSPLCICGFAPGNSFAGDAFAPAPPTTLEQDRCNSLGEGFVAVAGSGACVEISGHVSAGTDYSAVAVKSAQSSSPFVAKSTLGSMDARSGFSVQTQFAAPLGPARLYVQVGHDSQ